MIKNIINALAIAGFIPDLVMVYMFDSVCYALPYFIILCIAISFDD